MGYECLSESTWDSCTTVYFEFGFSNISSPGPKSCPTSTPTSTPVDFRTTVVNEIITRNSSWWAKKDKYSSSISRSVLHENVNWREFNSPKLINANFFSMHLINSTSHLLPQVFKNEIMSLWVTRLGDQASCLMDGRGKESQEDLDSDYNKAYSSSLLNYSTTYLNLSSYVNEHQACLRKQPLI